MDLNGWVIIGILMGLGGAVSGMWLDRKQQSSVNSQDSQALKIIRESEVSIEELVRKVLEIQLEHQRKNRKTERLIGFLSGLGSSALVTILFWLMDRFSQ